MKYSQISEPAKTNMVKYVLFIAIGLAFSFQRAQATEVCRMGSEVENGCVYKGSVRVWAGAVSISGCLDDSEVGNYMKQKDAEGICKYLGPIDCRIGAESENGCPIKREVVIWAGITPLSRCIDSSVVGSYLQQQRINGICR